MTLARLDHARQTGALSLPEGARLVLLEPAQDVDLQGLADVTLRVQHSFKPAFDHFEALGVPVHTTVTEAADVVHLSLPRSRDLARGLLAQAEDLAPGGLVIVDGAKTDGIDAMLKFAKTRVAIEGQVSKAHGKLFWFTAGRAFGDCALPAPALNRAGWVTQPGVFSADAVDEGSQVLVSAVPKTLKGCGADLGGGWGYLTGHLLDLPGVTQVDLVEADHRALVCAERNITDPRVTLHWADATRWGQDGTLDWVVMNPPFHVGRVADPKLGHAFMRAAARLLTPKGSLILVANRHLPYETTLSELFQTVSELDGTARFKVLHADHPKRLGRTGAVRRR